MLIEGIITGVIILALTLLAGTVGMPLLHRLQVGQTVRDDGPKSHYVKSGTPTFGGFFFLVPIALLGVYALLAGPALQPLAVLVLLVLLFAFVGFLDDYIKVRVSKKGLSVRQKTFLLLAFSILFTLYYLYLAADAPFLRLPFTGYHLMITGWWKLPYGVFVVVYLFFVCNSVNLTDGVDGLASSVTVLSSLALAAAGLLIAGDVVLARPAIWLSFAIAGGCLGFLAFNHHPAKVFMGDTGSQALGAGIAGIALLYGVPWLVALVGLIYMIESLSVIIQVAYFKKTGGKRIFRMSPIHHHYELGGWRENKIVLVFSLVTVISSLAGLLILG
jgi:phospho-N-acetylmuramoyl-pentapeptide-transferase